MRIKDVLIITIPRLLPHAIFINVELIFRKKIPEIIYDRY